METFVTVAITAASLITIIILGFLLRKTKVLDDSTRETLSKLEINLLFPFYVFSSLVKDFTVENLTKNTATLLYGVAYLVIAVIIGIILSSVFAKRGTPMRKVYFYVFVIANFGYFGYPLVEGAFGEEMKTEMVIFLIPLMIFNYTAGIHILESSKTDENGNFIKKKFKISPLLVGVFAGILFGLLPFELPDFVMNIVEKLSGCMSPVAMLLLGITLACVPFSKMLTEWRSYVVSAVRLIGIPVVMGLIFTLIGLVLGQNEEILILAVIVSGMPTALNAVIFLQGQKETVYLGAQFCIVSDILCMITIPLLTLYLRLLGVNI